MSANVWQEGNMRKFVKRISDGEDEFSIYIDDLKPEIQKEVLSFMGLETAKDGNYDVFPIFVLTKD